MATRLGWGQEEGLTSHHTGPGLVCQELIFVLPAGNLNSLPSVTRTATPQAPEQLPILPKYPVFLLGCLVLKEQSENPPSWP